MEVQLEWNQREDTANFIKVGQVKFSGLKTSSIFCYWDLSVNGTGAIVIANAFHL